MANRCSICQHEKSKQINRALVQGTSYRRIAAQYDLTASTVARHAKNCGVAKLIAKAQGKETETLEVVATEIAAEPMSNGDQLISELGAIRQTIDSLITDHLEPMIPQSIRDQAVHDPAIHIGLLNQRREEHKVALQAIREARGMIELIARLTGEISEKHLHIHASPEWLDLRTKIVGALRPYPDALRAVMQAIA